MLHLLKQKHFTTFIYLVWLSEELNLNFVLFSLYDFKNDVNQNMHIY